MTIKRGDTFHLSGVFKQPNKNTVNLNGINIELTIYDAMGRPVLVASSLKSYPNRSASITNVSSGTFEVIIKDTEVLKQEDYKLDVKTIGETGIVKSSKAIKLKVKNILE